ncbi:olfactory receptor 2D3-like [Eublepharis macularius]|uniref:Olfactory receptor n=1 Tax=Eublepharis macularius TaxID=481883 RepID=A0AA97K538_EUBMA|nr:olfactory receptor 2D3-like [Eublepharis macularius]
MGAENFTFVTEFNLEGLSKHRKTQILLFVVLLLIYSFTIMGNLAVILLVRSDSRLHTPMYFFLTHLSGAEICYATSTEPQMLAHLLAGNGILSFTGCVVQIFVVLFMGTAENFLLGIMAYDRYLAIFHPLLYTLAMSKRRQWQLAFACWAAAFLFSLTYVCCTFSHSYCGPNYIDHFICDMPLVLKLACDDTQITQAIISVMAGMGLMIPISLIMTSYGLILFSVLKMRSASGQRKAFSTCASHLIVVTVFYGTVISMYMIPRSSTSSRRDKQIAVFYVVVTPLLNPIIYTLRNKDVHGAVSKVLWRRNLDQKI